MTCAAVVAAGDGCVDESLERGVELLTRARVVGRGQEGVRFRRRYVTPLLVFAEVCPKRSGCSMCFLVVVVIVVINRFDNVQYGMLSFDFIYHTC